jgi:hypothetical protein
MKLESALTVAIASPAGAFAHGESAHVVEYAPPFHVTVLRHPVSAETRELESAKCRFVPGGARLARAPAKMAARESLTPSCAHERSWLGPCNGVDP